MFLLQVCIRALGAVTFTYNGSWSPSAPGNSVGAGDAIIISSRTFIQKSKLTVKNGATITINSGAQWKTGSKDLKIEDNSTLTNNGPIKVQGGSNLEIKNTAVFTNNGNVIVKNNGEIKAKR